jgi:hypothetical protein
MKRSRNSIMALTLLVGSLSLVSLTMLSTQALAAPSTYVSQPQLTLTVKPTPIGKPTPTATPSPTPSVTPTPAPICPSQVLVTTAWGTVCQPQNSSVTYLLVSLVCNYTSHTIMLYLPATTFELGPNTCDNTSTTPLFIATIVS